MHIDKYKIVSMDYTWKDGKKSKHATIKQTLTSDESIQDKDFISLLDSLNDVWHKYESKYITVEVRFEPHEED